MSEEALALQEQPNLIAYQRFLEDLLVPYIGIYNYAEASKAIHEIIKRTYGESDIPSIDWLFQRLMASSKLTAEETAIIKARYNFKTISGSAKPVNTFTEISHQMKPLRQTVQTKDRSHISMGRTRDVFAMGLGRLRRNPISIALIDITQKSEGIVFKR